MTRPHRRFVGCRRGGLAVVGLAVALLAAGCNSSPGPSKVRTITVFAAASLTQAFAAEGKAFEAKHPGVTVRFSFAGSQTLVAQLQQGAPADVLATADLATIARVRNKLSADPTVFARNQLAIITAPGNPLRIVTLTDLAKPGRRVVLAGPTVPVGKAAGTALKAAGVTVQPVSLEAAVSGVVTKVRLGEADAGIAYVTDLAGLGGVPLPGTVTSLAVAPATGASADSGQFVSFLLSPEGRRLLLSFGFLPPA